MLKQIVVVSLVWLFGANWTGASPAREASPGKSASAPAVTRTFLLTYSATVTGLPAGQPARVWLPVPPSSEDQDVEIVGKNVPAGERLAKEPKYGNRILYVEAKPDA